MRRVLEIGGMIAGVVLIAFAIITLVMAIDGRNTVRDSLARENITGSGETSLGGYTVAEGELVDTGTEARAFADLMRTHALEGTGGKTYTELGRFLDVNGEETSDPELAALNDDGTPVANPARETWVTQTALATALNLAYVGEQMALFGIMVGVALLLSGIGFLVLSVGGALRRVQAEEPKIAEASSGAAVPAQEST